MRVSCGHALVCSAALHALGLGAAGWATYDRYRGPAESVEFRTVRAYALRFLTLAPPKASVELRPSRRPSRAPSGTRRRAPTPPPTRQAAVLDRSDPAPPAVALHPEPVRPDQGPPTLQVKELAPGETAGVVGQVAAAASAEPSLVPGRGVDRAAALMAPVGSACPALPRPAAGGGGEVVVAVALEVDPSGRVDRSRVQVIESPGRQSGGRGFYPRIYVVGAREGREAGRVDPARYDSVVTHAVTSHVAGLEFRPAMEAGRPVSSTVLVACHGSRVSR